jgi:hypothetical protein
MPSGPATILGGLPVIADVSFGYDSYAMEHWADVGEIYWQKRNGEKGKPIPQHLRDRAEKYDPYFSTVIEQVQDHLIMEQARDDQPDGFLTFG